MPAQPSPGKESKLVDLHGTIIHHILSDDEEDSIASSWLCEGDERLSCDVEPDVQETKSKKPREEKNPICQDCGIPGCETGRCPRGCSCICEDDFEC